MTLPREPDPEAVRRSVEAALEEDLGDGGDVTTRALLRSAVPSVARLVARESLVVAGLPVARAVFRTLDPSVTFEARRAEGEAARPGERLAEVRADARTLLAGERTALNFLQRLSGIATAAREAVREVEGTGVVVLDTRKTAPGLRALDKYAVRVGGAENHRMGLYDAAMIKDTHVGATGSVGEAVRAVLAAGIPATSVTAEVRSREELEEAIEAGAGRALLDNMSLEALRECARVGKGRIVLEASGGLRPGTLRAVAETGVDCLSVGWLTHSVRAADLAMELVRER